MRDVQRRDQSQSFSFCLCTPQFAIRLVAWAKGLYANSAFQLALPEMPRRQGCARAVNFNTSDFRLQFWYVALNVRRIC